MKYYNLKNILSTNSDYNLIMGQRSNGKTYALLKYAIQKYINEGIQTVYLRRFDYDIKASRIQSLFNGIINNGIYKLTNEKYSDIKYYRGGFYLCNYIEKNKEYESDSKPFLSVLALNNYLHDKSRDFTNHNILIFDEFLAPKYLIDEFPIFLNVLSTVFRNRENCKVFLLGNTISFISPYFDELGIKDITKLKQGTIETYKNNNTKIAVEYCAQLNSKVLEKSKIFSISSPALKMINTGVWDISPYPKLIYKYERKNILFSFVIDYKNYLIQGELINLENNFFVYFHNKTSEIKKNELCYTDKEIKQLNYRRNFLIKKDKIDKKITELYLTGQAFYQNTMVGEIVYNFVYNTKIRGF